MAATMVIGNSLEMSPSLFNPANTMASIIVNEFAEAVSSLHTAALIEIALALFIVTLLLNIGARLLVWRVAKAPTGRGGD
jgi:phosphate transport system permease protein